MIQLDLYTSYKNITDNVTQFANDCVASKNHCNIAVSGGTTPIKLFQELEQRMDFPFKKCSFFWVDERCVPPSHEQSNFGMALKTMPSMKKGTVFRIRGEDNPPFAAKEYENILKKHLPVNESGFCVLDLILLGLGDDGHTASLFPEENSQHEDTHNVIHQYVRKLDSHRITLTLGALQAASKRIMLAVGKENAVEMLCDGKSVLGKVAYRQLS